MILGGIVVLAIVLLLTGLMYDFKQSNENRLFTMSLSGRWKRSDSVNSSLRYDLTITGKKWTEIVYRNNIPIERFDAEYNYDMETGGIYFDDYHQVYENDGSNHFEYVNEGLIIVQLSGRDFTYVSNCSHTYERQTNKDKSLI